MVNKKLCLVSLLAVSLVAAPSFAETKKNTKKPRAKPAVTAPARQPQPKPSAQTPPPVSPAVVAPVAAAQAAGVPFETKARSAFMIDLSTGTTLLDKDADRPIPPASMTKIMTIYLLFDQLKKGAITLDTTFMVSEKAWRTGGSKMFVPLGKPVRVEDLIRGIIIQSGNDAAVVVAEGLGGDEARFADMMNRKAAELGMKNSHFLNPDGLPAEGHVMSAHDLAILALRTMQDFPEYYHYYSEQEFVFNGIKQGNRNPLLYDVAGADGLKTGHTDEAGFGLVASAVRDGRRLIMVITGLANMKERSEESRRVMEYGFREFETVKLFSTGQTVDQAEVWMGQASHVGLLADRDVILSVRRDERQNIKATTVITTPVPAPIAAGTPLATLKVSIPNRPDMTLPLLAQAPVDRLGFLGRIEAGVVYLFSGAPAPAAQ